MNLLQMKKKFWQIIFSSDMFFIIFGVSCLFLSLILRFKIYTPSSDGYIVYLLVGLISIILSSLNYKDKESSLYSFLDRLLHVFFYSSIVILLFLGFYYFAPSLHAAKWLIPILRIVLFILGIHTTVLDNFMLFVYNGKTYKFAISYEQFAVIFFLVICVILMFYYLLKEKDIKQFFSQLLLTFLYSIFRYVILIFVYIYFDNIGIFYKPFYILISIIPLLVILTIRNKVNKCSFEDGLVNNLKGNILPAVIVSCSISLLVYGFFLFDGNGEIKKGKIYIDEYHSEGWESVFEPLNVDNFGGQKSTYTYFSFVKLLEKIKPVHIITSSDDYNNLTSEDILIIKTPTLDFTDAELSKIDTVLKNGAGVWIIGDHTNLLDMSSRLNKIIEPYGAKFNYDSIYDLTTSNLTYFDNTLLPLFKHRINSSLSRYKFATSCSINTSPLFSKIMIANNACSENYDLSHQNYFGDLSFSEEEYFGLFNQCVAKEVGKGRLLIYSDSTTLSSFSVFMHTNPEFIASSIEYLSRKNSFNFPILISVILFVISFLLIILRIRKGLVLYINGFFVILIIVLPLSLLIISRINDLENTNFKNKIENTLNSIPAIYFLQDEDEYDNSLIVRWWSSGIDEYTSFFLAFQRLGFQLREIKNFINQDIAKNRLTVVPKYITSTETIKDIVKYCNSGGKVLLCLPDRNLKETFEFFYNFGINYEIAYNSYESNFEGDFENDEKPSFKMIDFYPNSYSYHNSYFSSNYTNIRIDEFYAENNGKIYVLVNSHFFDNIGLGEAATIPTHDQIMLHKELFELIKKLNIE